MTLRALAGAQGTPGEDVGQESSIHAEPHVVFGKEKVVS